MSNYITLPKSQQQYISMWFDKLIFWKKLKIFNKSKQNDETPKFRVVWNNKSIDSLETFSSFDSLRIYGSADTLNASLFIETIDEDATSRKLESFKECHLERLPRMPNIDEVISR